ncbi:transposase [Erysipelothrix rhusiopathiae]|uniref:transposase n=1 Tax=Erysipelothrix rhusiopathiae TaxID=1648 RepID=UPI00248093CB|nr:transposase [Erysipelothrix rhusiopathiae]
MEKRTRRKFTDEFKTQIVKLYQGGRSAGDLARDYDLNEQLVYRWVKQQTTSGSFKAAVNRTDEENELIKLRKENQQLKMENDILKQAALPPVLFEFWGIVVH